MALSGVYTGARLAYSLRNLPGYTGSVVRVRRSNDNAESDFTGAEIIDGTLTAWTGANNGFVVKFYEQTGNGEHGEQSTSGLQHKIVDSGDLIYDGDRPCVVGVAGNAYFIPSITVARTNLTVYAVGKINNASGSDAIGFLSRFTLSPEGNYAFSCQIRGNTIAAFKGETIWISENGSNALFRYTNTVPSANRQVLCYVYDASLTGANERYFYINNALPSLTSSASTSTSNYFDNTDPLLLFSGNGTFQEMIFWPDDKESDRNNIYEDVRQYYFGDPLLLDENPNAARAYSLRKLRSTYQGPAIRVRVSNNNSEADIGFDAFGNLDLAALASHVGANNGFIVTWYDQSTSGANATQSTSGQQPRIRNSGTNENAGGIGRVGVFFDGSNDFMSFSNLNSNTNWTQFVVSKRNANGVRGGYLSGSGSSSGSYGPTILTDNSAHIYHCPSSGTNQSFYRATSAGIYTNEGLVVAEGYHNSTTLTAYINNTALSLGNKIFFTSNTTNWNYLGRVSAVYTTGHIAEAILWTFDKTADRADIYEDVRSYYFDTPLGGTNLTTGAPTLTEPVLTEEGDDYDLEGTNLTTGSPTVTEPVLTQEQALTGTDLSTGSPTVSSPILTEQTNQPLEGSNLTTGSPTITSPVLTEFILPPLPDDVIAFADFTSDLGRQWRVAIHDLENENPPLTTPNMTIRGNGFNLDYESPNDTIHEVIKASKCSTTLVIDPTDSYLISMIQAIALADIGRYYLVIYEDTGEDYGVYWWGPIDTELVKEPDKWPSEVELIATDSLGLMAEKNYNPIGGGLFNGLNTFGQILAKAFERVGNGSAVRGDEDYVKLATNWYNAAMPDTTVDPMLYTAIRQETFWKVSEKESVIQIRPWKVSEVMDAVLNGWNARIIMSKGYYHIEQPDLYANNNINRQIIDSDGAAVSRTSEGVVRNIDQTDLFTTHGGYREWARPLQTSRRTHKHEGSNNVLIPDDTYQTPVAFPYSGLPLATNIALEPKTLKVRFAIRLKVTNRKSTAFDIRFIGFKCRLLLENVSNSTIANLFKPTMGSQMQWSAIPNERYGFISNSVPKLLQDEQHDQVIVMNFETPTFTGDGFDENLFQLDFGDNSTSAAYKRFYPTLGSNVGVNVPDVAVIGWSGDPYSSGNDNKLVLQYKVLGAQIIFDDNNSNEIDYEAENGNVESGNTYDCPVVLPFGDVVHHLVEPGALRVWNGTGYEANQNGWGDGNLSGDEAFHYLAANEVAALRYRPQDRQYFDLYGIIDAVDNVNYQGSRYAFIGGSYSARADRWTGYWQRLGKSKVGIIGGGITVNFPPISNITWLWADPNGPNLTLNAAQGLDPTQVGITSAPILADPNVTTIPIVPPNHSGIKAGMIITVKSTTTGVMQEFEVGADVEPTDTSITVVGQELLGDIDAGAQVIVNFSNYVDVLGEIYTGTYEPLSYWEEDAGTSGVNATVHANRWRPKGSATNIDAVIQPKGTGAILAQMPDGTAAGGNKRGAYAVDLQTSRGTNSNVASGLYSTISGGADNTASGEDSTVSGGTSNSASGEESTVGGGNGNTASNTHATVSGGSGNAASAVNSTVGGGLGNLSSGDISVIAGGFNNDATGTSSTVAGGSNNQSTNEYSSVLGGNGNTASGQYSAVAGGRINVASAEYSAILSGEDNLASGSYSLAAGRYSASTQYGQRAFASGRFSTRGDCQQEEFVMRRVTTDDTPTILTADGSSPVATNTIGIASGELISGMLLIQGIDTSTKDYQVEQYSFFAQNIAGTTSGNRAIIYVDNPLGGTVTLVFNDTDNRFDIEVTGLAATTIRWNAYVQLIRIKT